MLKNIGNYSVVAELKSKSNKVVASFGSSDEKGSGSTTSRALGSGAGIYDRDILDGFLNYRDLATVRRIARDIHDFDAISGSAIDMLANAPFSQFEISGLPNQEMMNVYSENLNALDITTIAPEIARNHMRDGEFVGVINEDKNSNLLSSVMPIDLEVCEFVDLPFPNRDPVIDVLIPDNIKQLMRSKDPRIRRELENYGSSLDTMIKNKKYPLDPKTTIYFPRRTVATNSRGTSYLKRIIPVWLIEKALMKGMIDLAHRRQRSILHITAGTDEYIATDAQLGQISELFRRADADPTGAIVATGPDIQTNELRNGSDFWKPEDAADWFLQQKMRALGVSESLIAGDLTVDATTNVMTLFLDNLRHFRENFTRKIFYQKILLLIAIKNDFRVSNNREKITSNDSEYNEINAYLNSNYRLIDGSNKIVAFDDNSYKLADFHLPKIQYHKALKPEGNNEILTNLGTLQQQGLPIPLRMWAVAAGISIPELLRMTDEDITLRKRLMKYKSQWPVDPQAQAQQLIQSSDSLQEVIAKSIMNEKAPVKRIRDFSNIEMRDSLTGKKLSKKGADVVNEKANKTIAQAIKRINTNHNDKIKQERPVNKRFHYSKNPYGLLELYDE